MRYLFIIFVSLIVALVLIRRWYKVLYKEEPEDKGFFIRYFRNEGMKTIGRFQYRYSVN